MIYPQTCGICGKLHPESLCKKCHKMLDSQQITGFLEKEQEMAYFDELIYLFSYEGPIRELLLAYKFKEKAYLYKTIVNFLLNQEKIFEKLQSYDTIIPVPISNRRRKERGYNQSLLIAKEMSKELNLLLITDCLYKTKHIPPQSELNKEERVRNVQSVYELRNQTILENKKILILDDIYTTGSTIKECSKILQTAKPKKIGAFVIAKD